MPPELEKLFTLKHILTIEFQFETHHFINNLLSATSNPIHSFADDSTLSFSYSFPNSRPCSSAVEEERQRMLNSLNSDLDSIIKWGSTNRVEFNASKTQCCLLSLKRNQDPQPLSMNGTCIAETERLAILGMCINNHLRWNDHIFEVAPGLVHPRPSYTFLIGFRIAR